MREPLTEEQLEAVTECCLCDPEGWVPRPDNLPLAEELAERGLLTRRMIGHEAVYFVSSEFRAASALNAALGEPSLN